MFGITLTMVFAFGAGFVVGSLFPQPEKVKNIWNKVKARFN